MVQLPLRSTKAWLAMTGVALAFVVGVGVGRSAKPSPPSNAVPCVEGVADELEDAEKGTAAVVEIISNMAEGRSANDPTSLSLLRDSMQEITASLGSIRSQIEALKRAGRMADCGVP